MKTKNFKYYSGKKYDNMMGRCYRESDRSYKDYGERGIKVCSAWITNIDNFRNWIKMELQRLSVTEEDFVNNPKNFSLDRIDTNGHYSPENCRLVNAQVQMRNIRKRKTLIVISAEGFKHTI